MICLLPATNYLIRFFLVVSSTVLLYLYSVHENWLGTDRLRTATCGGGLLVCGVGNYAIIMRHEVRVAMY